MRLNLGSRLLSRRQRDMSSKLAKNAQLKVYLGFDHGMCTTYHDVINADLLRSSKRNARCAVPIA
jgi:hypothetical protein